ncbi:hypothetical protein BH20ACT2_BH20ACT2_14400 [soil metagenome]
MAVVRATYELDPPDLAPAVAAAASTGPGAQPSEYLGEVTDASAGSAGTVTIDFPAGLWGEDLTGLLGALVHPATAVPGLRQCRLAALDLPAGWLPGPAFAAPEAVLLGATVHPALGLSPAQFGGVAVALADAGVELVCDPPLLGDPGWCSFHDRVIDVVSRIPHDVSYVANVTGAASSVISRAAWAVDHGVGGLAVNPLAQGLDVVRMLREADFGVPILATRTGAGPWVRGGPFGVASAVLAGLLRQAGADSVGCGAFGGASFDIDADVAAQIDACRHPLPDDPDLPAAVAVLEGDIGPADVAAQTTAAGGTGVMVLLGGRLATHPAGLAAGVAEALGAISS